MNWNWNYEEVAHAIHEPQGGGYGELMIDDIMNLVREHKEQQKTIVRLNNRVQALLDTNDALKTQLNHALEKKY